MVTAYKVSGTTVLCVLLLVRQLWREWRISDNEKLLFSLNSVIAALFVANTQQILASADFSRDLKGLHGRAEPICRHLWDLVRLLTWTQTEDRNTFWDQRRWICQSGGVLCLHHYVALIAFIFINSSLRLIYLAWLWTRFVLFHVKHSVVLILCHINKVKCWMSVLCPASAVQLSRHFRIGLWCCCQSCWISVRL